MRGEFHIVLVEDSRADVKIIERALAEAGVAHRLTVFPDGRQALIYFDALDTAAPPHAGVPALVLLDLNLPGIDGHQVLAHLKGHPVLRVIPVVVLTTSRRDEDVLASYRAGANSFIAKPDEYPHYRELVQTLQNYWHRTVLKPPWPLEPG